MNCARLNEMRRGRRRAEKDVLRLGRTLGNLRFNQQDAHDYNPADLAFGNSYELRLRNGSKFLIDATKGFNSQIIDRDGNTLTFTGQAIVSSAGRGVYFERDFANRIAGLTARRKTWGTFPTGIHYLSVSTRLAAESSAEDFAAAGLSVRRMIDSSDTGPPSADKLGCT